ncbi:hypothetical protein J132_01641 [Termitomyces sp. J132]|nr:hypothetical protein J132_01641 [Termitomyces sp. J132]
MMLINNKEEVECINNSGSQIILMSVEIASDLGLSYNPNIVLNMQSTNGTLDQLLGLAQNIPCTIGNIMVYLQIHVLQSPAYDILLGHPFDVLTCSMINTLSDVKTTITITDPNTGQRCTIPTFPSVDTSYIAVGYYLCQCTSNNRKECHYHHFGLITLNDREARSSQPKLEQF